MKACKCAPVLLNLRFRRFTFPQQFADGSKSGFVIGERFRGNDDVPDSRLFQKRAFLRRAVGRCNDNRRSGRQDGFRVRFAETPGDGNLADLFRKIACGGAPAERVSSAEQTDDFGQIRA